jgi:hypothetical protein
MISVKTELIKAFITASVCVFLIWEQILAATELKAAYKNRTGAGLVIGNNSYLLCSSYRCYPCTAYVIVFFAFLLNFGFNGII